MKRRVLTVMLSLAVTVTSVPATAFGSADGFTDGQAAEIVAAPEEEIVVEDADEFQAEVQAPETSETPEEAEVSDGEEIAIDMPEEISLDVPEAEITTAEEVPEETAEFGTETAVDVPELMAGESLDLKNLKVMITDGSELTFQESRVATEGTKTITFDPAKAAKGEDQDHITVASVKYDTDGFSAGDGEAEVETLIEDEDYEVEAINCKDAATSSDANAPQLIIRFISEEYKSLDHVIVKFTIEQKTLTEDDLDITYEGKALTDAQKTNGVCELDYNGKNQYPTGIGVAVKVGDEKYPLTEGKDFTFGVSGGDAKQNGEKKLTISGNGNYKTASSLATQLKYTIKKIPAEGNVTCGSYNEETKVLVFYDEGTTLNNVSVIETAIKNTLVNLKDSTDTSLSKLDGQYIVLKGSGPLDRNENAESGDGWKADGVHTYTVTPGGSFEGEISGTYLVHSGRTLAYIYDEANKLKNDIHPIDKAIEEAAVYKGQDISGDISKAIRKAIGDNYTTDTSLTFDEGNESQNKLEAKCISTKDGEVIDCGTYTFKIAGKENSKWKNDSYEVEVTVTPRQLRKTDGTFGTTETDVTAKVTQTYYADKTYGKPVVEITDNIDQIESERKNLTEGTDFVIVDSDYDESKGNAASYVTISGKGNYKTTIVDTTKETETESTAKITITPPPAAKVDLSDDSVTAEMVKTFNYKEDHVLTSADIKVTQKLRNGETVVIDPICYEIDGSPINIEDLPAGEYTLTIQGTESGKVTCDKEKQREVICTIVGTDFGSDWEFKTGELKAEMGTKVTTRPDFGITKKTGVDTLDPGNYLLAYWTEVPVKNETTGEVTVEKQYVKKPFSGTFNPLSKLAENEEITWFATTLDFDDGFAFPKAGTYYVEAMPNHNISSMKGYSGTIGPVKFEVSQRSLETLDKEDPEEHSTKLEVTIATSVSWPGHPVELSDLSDGITIMDKGVNEPTGVKLNDGSTPNPDYSVTISNNDKVGTATVTITGEGNYKGTITRELKIEKTSLNNPSATLTLKTADKKVPMSDPIKDALTPDDVEVMLPGNVVVDPKEYTVICAYHDASKKAVDIRIEAVETGNYKDGKTFNNVALNNTADISNAASFKLGYADPVYYYKADGENAGKQANLTLTDTRTNTVLKGQEGAAVIDPKKDLKPAYDYTITYEGLDKLADSDSATVTVTLEGVSGLAKAGDTDPVGYTGKITQIYLAKKPSLKTVELKAGQEFTYTGKEIIPEITSVMDDNGQPVAKENYTVRGSIDAGEAKVVVIPVDGSGYIGSASAAFTIAQAVNEIETVVPQIHVGESRKIEAQAKEGELTFALKSGTAAAVAADGTVTGKAEGEAVVTVTSATTKNYKGTTKDVAVKVLPAEPLKNIESYTVTLKETSFTYDGTEKKPEIVSVANGSTVLKASDYEVFYEHNTNAGTATVKVLGKEPYTGTATATFTIEKAANAVKAKDVQRLFMSKARKFNLQASATYANAPLSYKSDNSKIKVDSKGNVTIAAGYAGSATITVTAAATTNYKAASKTVKVSARPSTTEITRLSQNGTGIRVQYKKNSVADVFQIQYSTSQDFENAKSVIVRNPKCLVKTVPSAKGGLKKGVYYVRVRVLKFVDGTMANGAQNRLYSPWSNTVKKTMK